MTNPTRTATPVREAISPEDRAVFDVLEQTLADARTRDYTGWDYGDGMSSAILRALPLDRKWVNVAFQELVKRSPINVRPLLLVEQRRNYKGTALFAMANQTVAELDARGVAAGEQSVDYAEEARSLFDWLVDNASDGYAGYCAGHPHPIQHLDGRGSAGEPDIINTAYGVRALLRAADYDSRYSEAVATAPEFVTNDLNYSPVDTGSGAVVDYHTKHPQDYYTINAGAICARMFVDLYDHFENETLRARATELLEHVVSLQTDRGGWMYRDPPEASHLSMDTHHNGYIIESLQRYREVTGDDRFEGSLAEAMEFFRRDLFRADGAPNFDEESAYPRDIHASTQGALVFTYHGDLDFARRILQWVFDNLQAAPGRFYFRRERLFARRVVLMRWCQAWMAYAMAEYLDARATPSGRV